MTTRSKAAALLAAVVLSSCALSKAIYLGNDVYSRKAGPQSVDSGEHINGVFPEAVYIKTRTQTFNAYHYYILNNGRIWYKSIDRGQEPVYWALFQETGLPDDSWKISFNKPERIVEIAADADELLALSDEGGFYRYCFDKTIAHKSKVWLDRQGWPNEEQLFLDQRTAKNRSWALGKRNTHVLYYEDPFGNQHHNGTMEIATTYVLLEDGQEICYADTGLPGDFSRNYIGPERGKFKAETLSASASTMFVINEAGEMYTRLADFDTIGCDPMLFKYTYTSYTSDLSGDNYFSNLSEWGLPAEDWRPQPSIPLSGKAALTRHITILQNGQGNGARELRVAGLNESGDTGYWTKAIFDETWTFKSVPLYFNRAAILRGAESAGGDSRGERGTSLDKAYRGYRWNGGEKETEWEYAVPNFNILEGDCDLRITWRGQTSTLKLHPVEMWTYLKRDYLPGRTGFPKLFLATLEIPENAFDGLSVEFALLLTEKYAKYNKKLFQYTLAASEHYILLRDSEDSDFALFLTDEGMSNQYTEFYARLLDSFEEIQRYRAPELTIDPNETLTYEDLLQKIESNKAFRDELKYQIRALKWSQLTAFKFNASYLPAHYMAIITPLRFVDVPKIRTITSFGERIALTNSSYIYTTSTIYTWIYEKVLELLEVRLRYYRDLAKELPGTAANAQGTADSSFPQWYAEDISAYWDIAGLPRVIPGAFFSAGAGQSRTQTHAVLSFVPSGAEPELLGWYFSIGETDSPAKEDNRFSIFIDPLKSARAIYSRGGKTPAEKTVQLDGVLYFNPRTASSVERELIDNALKPFIQEDKQGIDVRIRFDGRTLEIREYPSKRPEPLIFRGEL